MKKPFRWLRADAEPTKVPLAGQGGVARSKGRNSWRRRLPYLVTLCLLSILICIGLDNPQSKDGTSPLSYFEQFAYSFRMMIFGEQRQDLVEKAQQKIVLVTLKDTTYLQLPGPNLPREYHARVVRELTQAGAKVIGFDLLFDQPSRENPQGDKELAAAAKQSGKMLWASVTRQINDNSTLIRPLPSFLQASPYEGHINSSNLVFKKVEQPIVDRLKAFSTDGGVATPAFSLMAAYMASHPAGQSKDLRLINEWVKQAQIPLDSNGDFKITFIGGDEQVFPEIAYEAIYRGEAQREFYSSHQFFRGKIVLIGDNTTFSNDHRYTPIGELAGVEIHAHAIATLLLGCFIRETPLWVNIALIVFMGAIVCPIARAQKLQWIVLNVLLVLTAYFFLNIWLFVFYGWWLHLVGPCAALFLSTIFTLIERGLFEEREKEHMFDALVSAAGSAIERRDPSTSGHSQRVTALTLALAEAVSEQKKGPFRDVHFSKAQLKELRYAGLLHDFGKIGVRENVLTKSHKLEPRHLEAVVGRLLVARQTLALRIVKRQLAVLGGEETHRDDFALQNLNGELHEQMAQIDEDLILLEKSNDPMVTYLPDPQYEQLQKLLDRLENVTYADASGQQSPVISLEERQALSIRKGSLTPEEYREVQKHAALSFDFLKQIPWTDSLCNIPEIARTHHEKLNGSGYPLGLKAGEISLQARMMTIADIYDALTAADRPYKKAMPVDKALHILQSEAQTGALDAALLEIFIEQQVYVVTEQWSYVSPSPTVPNTPIYAAS